MVKHCYVRLTQITIIAIQVGPFEVKVFCSGVAKGIWPCSSQIYILKNLPVFHAVRMHYMHTPSMYMGK